MADLHGPFEKTLSDLQAEHRTAPRSRVTMPQGEEEEQRPFRNYVRDVVLGFNDGLVSTFAATAGVAGAFFTGGSTAALGGRGVGVVGVAIALAGAFSMALGEYLSTKSQQEYYEAERAREKEHIATWPHLEKIEVREALQKKGLEGELLEQATDSIASRPDALLDFMMREEFGLGEETARNPVWASGIIFGAFLGGAAIPVVPYFLFAAPASGLAGSMAASVGGLFAAGWWRGWISGLNPWRRSAEMVLLGGAAAIATFVVGRAFGLVL